MENHLERGSNTPMKIALIGYGKMGKLIEQKALDKGHSIIAVMDSKKPVSLPSSKQAISHADVVIDFSTPDSVMGNLRAVADLKKNLVMGTTGWTDKLGEAERIVNASGIGFLHSPNFSLGVALFFKLMDKAASLLEPFDQYDAAGIEIHHKNKLDSPSGTAKLLSTRINAHRKHPITFSSVRVGSVPGTHTVVFDSPADSITLTHTAHNREGFAGGALHAAEWLQGKKGIFTLDDLL